MGNHVLLTLDEGLWFYWVHRFEAGCSLMASAVTKLGGGLREAVSPVAVSGEHCRVTRLVTRLKL